MPSSLLQIHIILFITDDGVTEEGFKNKQAETYLSYTTDCIYKML